jgi:hypothetical protein
MIRPVEGQAVNVLLWRRLIRGLENNFVLFHTAQTDSHMCHRTFKLVTWFVILTRWNQIDLDV